MENMRIRRNVLKDLSEMTICQAYAAKSFIHSNGKFAKQKKLKKGLTNKSKDVKMSIQF